jgi:Tfp pilus assembly pilus retraction ATPase PilT
LVFSTLHTPDARQTVTRITHFYTHEEQVMILDQISKNLQAAICQRLVRTADGKGRVPCCEIMFSNPVVSKLIVENRIEDLQQVLRSGQDGMQTFDMALCSLVKGGMVAMEEALTVVEDDAAFRRLLKGIHAGGDRGALLG